MSPNRITSTYFSIATALGYRASGVLILASAVLAVSSLFYIFTLGSFLKVNVFDLKNGVTYDTYFSDTYVINKYNDHVVISFATVIWLLLLIRGKIRIILPTILGGLTAIASLGNFDSLLDFVALASIPLVISILVYDKISNKKIINGKMIILSVNYFAIICTVIGILAIMISLSSLFPIFSLPPIHNYAYEIFVLFSAVSPVLMVLFILCIPFNLMFKEIMIRFPSARFRKMFDSVSLNGKIKTKYKLLFIALFMLLSATMVVIPHQAIINKKNQQIGVDTHDYVNYQSNLTHAKNAQDLMRQAFVRIEGGDRPLSLFFIFVVVKGIHASNPSSVIDNLPIILGPALVLVIFFLTLEITSDDTSALLASFLTAVSFHVLVGMYAGFYANWFALILGYLSFVFMLRFLKKPNKLTLITYSALIIAVIFCHEYTWTVTAIVMGVFLILVFKLNYYSRWSIFLLMLIVLSTVVIDISKNSLIGRRNGLAKDMAVSYQQGAGIGQFSQRWNNIKDTMLRYYGAQFGNVILLALGLYWVFRTDLRESSSLLLMIFLTVGIVPLFFGDWVIQSRVFYDIPLQIPSALGLNYLRRQANGFIFLIPISLWLVAMAIRAVSNYISLP